MSALRAVEPTTVYLVKQEMAHKLRISLRTLDRYMAQGLPYYKRFGRVWFDEAEGDRWVKERAS